MYNNYLCVVLLQNWAISINFNLVTILKLKQRVLQMTKFVSLNIIIYLILLSFYYYDL